jgi:hypothetical protein
MYEKPQYMTGKGLRRTAANPLKDKRLILANQKLSSDLKYLLKRKAQQPFQLSPEAAKAIAVAIKGLLKQ